MSDLVGADMEALSSPVELALLQKLIDFPDTVEMAAKEFLNKYTEELANEYDKETIMQEESMTLADVYIEPNFGIYKHCIKKEGKKTVDNGNGLLEFDFDFTKPFKLQETSLHEIINNWNLNKRLLSNIDVKNSDLILLLGNPGQGKTSFCKRFLHDYFHDYKYDLLKKPIFRIKSTNLTDVQRLIDNPLDWLFEYLKGRLPEIDRHLFNQSLLVLDGLDELMVTEQLNYSSIDLFCRNLLRIAESFSELKIIITSRFHVDIEKLKNTNPGATQNAKK